jgi:hypothetical protein
VSVSKLETFLARIYVDRLARERFLNNPSEEAADAGLSLEEIDAVKEIDQVGLELFVDSLERKRGRSHRLHG